MHYVPVSKQYSRSTPDCAAIGYLISQSFYGNGSTVSVTIYWPKQFYCLIKVCLNIQDTFVL